MWKSLGTTAFILISLIFIFHCGKKIINPVQDNTVYAINDYFPLNIGDKWCWRIGIDILPEPYMDGDSVLGEPFFDVNDNGIYDDTIDGFTDLNGNGIYDGPNDPWIPGTPYKDINANGEYDAPNGRFDSGEPFCDLNGNRVWDLIRKRLEVDAEIMPYGKWVYGLASLRCAYFFIATYDNEDTTSLIALEDAFTNDSLGLRWHGHIDWTSTDHYLSNLKPIIIAKESTQVGDVLFYTDSLTLDHSSHTVTWISTLLGREEVTTPAGRFTDCLKFKSEASGWFGNMGKWNGTSYQWYAKGVGLVKSYGLSPSSCCILVKATVGEKVYPF